MKYEDLKKLWEFRETESEDVVYEEIRRYLILNSFVMKHLWDVLTKKVQSSSKKHIQVAEAKRMELLLNLWYQLLYIGGEKLYKHSQDIVIVQDDPVLVTERGIYVRWNPFLTEQEWRDKYDRVKYLADELKLFKNAKKTDFQKSRVREQMGDNDFEHLDLYLKIEAKIAKYWKEKQKVKVKTPDSTGESSGVSIFDRAMEDILAPFDREDDKALDKLKLKYKTIYYDLCERYKIPTLRELPHYLKILADVAS